MAGDPGPLYAVLKARLKDAVRSGATEPGAEIVELDRAAIAAAAAQLKAAGLTMLVDLTAVDWRGYKSAGKPERFELVYQFFSVDTRQRIRIKVAVPEDDAVAPTLSGLFGDANWLEREVWDMYGIRFEGHPDPRRILMYEEFSGHPLRKDYPLLKQQPRVAQVFPGVPPFGGKPAKLETDS